MSGQVLILKALCAEVVPAQLVSFSTQPPQSIHMLPLWEINTTATQQ